jgi:hypothetical protein
VKLAEALSRRADLTTRIAELRGRALASAQHQEGDDPVEDPSTLLTESDRAAAELQAVIVRINTTNLRTEMQPGVTVTDALARRDVLRLRHRFRTDLAERAAGLGQRFMRSEIRLISSVDVRALRTEADEIARELRELDTRLQEVNWTTELPE